MLAPAYLYLNSLFSLQTVALWGALHLLKSPCLRVLKRAVVSTWNTLSSSSFSLQTLVLNQYFREATAEARVKSPLVPCLLDFSVEPVVTGSKLILGTITQSVSQTVTPGGNGCWILSAQLSVYPVYRLLSNCSINYLKAHAYYKTTYRKYRKTEKKMKVSLINNCTS